MTNKEPIYCAVCLLEGKRVPMNKRGVCPFQAAERKMVSEMRRTSVKATADERDEKAGFDAR